MIANAFANQDMRLQRRSARITRNLLAALKDAAPEVDRQLIGDIVADLTSLWDTGQKLDTALNTLYQTQSDQKRIYLYDFLAFIEAIQIDMAEFWIGNLRSKIPKLRKALQKRERKERHVETNR
jgi:hypothetical protein